MEKLTLKDITILSEGKQIRKAILKKFSSIEEFADRVGLYPNSVQIYLRDRKVGTDKFKIKLIQELDRGYDEIVKKASDQIKDMVHNVSENIRRYNADDDIKVLEGIQNLCISHGMDFENFVMIRAIGMHHFYRNELNASIQELKIAIEKIKPFSINHEIIYTVELALMYFHLHDYQKSIEIFKNTEKNISDSLEQSTLFKFYYSYGILLNQTKQCKKARRLFELAVQFGPDIVSKGRAIMNIGLSFKKDGDFEEALKRYKETLELFEGNLEKQNIVLNNIAEVYRLQGNFDGALRIIKNALDTTDRNNIQDYFIFYKTYVEIKAAVGQVDSAIDELISLIEESVDKFVANPFVIEAMNNTINLSNSYKKLDKLDRLQKIILGIIEKNYENNEYIEELEKMLGRIIRCLNNKL